MPKNNLISETIDIFCCPRCGNDLNIVNVENPVRNLWLNKHKAEKFSLWFHEFCPQIYILDFNTTYRVYQRLQAFGFFNVIGGEGGIRTLGTLRFNGFRDRPIQPLSHLSKNLFNKSILRLLKFPNPLLL